MARQGRRAIKLDDTIVEISTDKVDVELPSPASGTVTEILVQEGDTVTVGQVIARIAPGGGAAPDGTAAATAPQMATQESTGNGASGAGSRNDELTGGAARWPGHPRRRQDLTSGRARGGGRGRGSERASPAADRAGGS